MAPLLTLMQINTAFFKAHFVKQQPTCRQSLISPYYIAFKSGMLTMAV